MVVCADTSFLFSYYGYDTHTERAKNWIRNSEQSIVISTLTEYELTNALRFAEFRKAIASGEAMIFLSQFKVDQAKETVIVLPGNLSKILDGAKRLSSTYTIRSGHRGFGILNVASALHLGATHFLSFDQNQNKLARAEGLEVLA